MANRVDIAFSLFAIWLYVMKTSLDALPSFLQHTSLEGWDWLSASAFYILPWEGSDEEGDADDSDNADDAHHAKGDFDEDKNSTNDMYDDDHYDNHNHHGDDRGHHKYDGV